MNCEELLAAINQYVDGELEPGVCLPFQAHLADCNPCQVVVDNIRQTIQLYHAEEPFEIPPALHDLLSGLVRRAVQAQESADDHALTQQAKAGDFAALEALLLKYERQIFGVARRIVGRQEDAEEVTQQTFVAVLEHLGEFRQESQLRTWLLRIATNQALALLRKRARREGVPYDENSGAEPDSYTGLPHPEFIAAWRETPEELAIQRETRQHLDAALNALAEKYRVVFVLRDIEGISTRETAEMLGLSPEAVKVRLLRARLMLRERLTRLYGDEAQQFAPHSHA